MKYKSLIFIFLVFSSLLIIGCSSVTQADKKKENQFYPSIEALINVNGTEYKLKRGGYQWESKQPTGEIMSESVDYASPYQMSQDIEAVTLKPNQKVNIKVKGEPLINLNLWNDTGREKEVKLNENQFITPDKQGKYIYEVFATWENGEAYFTFVVEIQ